MDNLQIVMSMLIEYLSQTQVREKVAAGGLSSVQMDTAGDDIEVIELLGEGSFGKVGDKHYKFSPLEHPC